MYLVIWFERGEKKSERYASLGGAERRKRLLESEGYKVEIKALH